jgi:hypothetical protein
MLFPLNFGVIIMSGILVGQVHVVLCSLSPFIDVTKLRQVKIYMIG